MSYSQYMSLIRPSQAPSRRFTQRHQGLYYSKDAALGSGVVESDDIHKVWLWSWQVAMKPRDYVGRTHIDMLHQQPTCHKDPDWMLQLGLLLALPHSLQDVVDHFVIEAAGQPALEEAHMHQGAGAQPVSAPCGGVGNPPNLSTMQQLLSDTLPTWHKLLGAGTGVGLLTMPRRIRSKADVKGWS